MSWYLNKTSRKFSKKGLSVCQETWPETKDFTTVVTIRLLFFWSSASLTVLTFLLPPTFPIHLDYWFLLIMTCHHRAVRLPITKNKQTPTWRAGRVIGEKAWVSLCNYAEKWSSLTNKQKRGFRISYGESCICKVRENRLQPSPQFSFQQSSSSSSLGDDRSQEDHMRHVARTGQQQDPNNESNKKKETDQFLSSLLPLTGIERSGSGGGNDTKKKDHVNRNSCHWSTKWDSTDCQSLHSICKPILMSDHSHPDEDSEDNEVITKDESKVFLDQSNVNKKTQNQKEAGGKKRKSIMRTSSLISMDPALTDHRIGSPRFGSSSLYSEYYNHPVRRRLIAMRRMNQLHHHNQKTSSSSLLEGSSFRSSDPEIQEELEPPFECRWVSSGPYRECLKNRNQGHPRSRESDENPNGIPDSDPWKILSFHFLHRLMIQLSDYVTWPACRPWKFFSSQTF